MGPGFEPLRAYFFLTDILLGVDVWRDGRVVDCIGLENRRTERYRGFESLSLRLIKLKPADFQRVSCFSPLEVPFEVPFFLYESLTRNL